KANQSDIQYGTLTVWLDTAHTAKLWLERALFTFGSGIARALILGLVLFYVYHLLMTRPLFRIIRSMASVNPDQPGDHLIQVPRGHERDELGLWVTTTNKLLRAINESQSKRHAAEARINRLSRYDMLTGLPNRELFLSLLSSAIDEARRNDYMLAVFVCALDDFKGINEDHGYHQGDRLLQILSDRLTSEHDNRPLAAGRLGGDQFVVIEYRVRENFQAANTAEWLLCELSRPAQVDGQNLQVTATLGVSLFPEDAEDADKLLQRAEQAMTLAKNEGCNRFQFYVATLDQAIRDRKALEKDLTVALAENQFHLVFQPQINLESARCIGAEVLLRWRHPERGMVPPDEFIPLAELNRTIIEIGHWVLDQSCRQAAQWLSQGMRMRIAVNLSAVQLHQPEIVSNILRVLEHHQLPPELLELEVTETSFMENLDDAVRKLSELRNHGIHIAVDDFGTGYSSLTYLKRLPVQHLKIDKQFIRDLLVHEDDTRIVNTIIDLSRSLGLNVVAEGVETAEQRDYLIGRGCHLVQGYFFSRPVPASDFEAFYMTFNSHEGTPDPVQTSS
ncbi:MAG: EAL domain-containing protein, partial [Gammaproteobacteria bacterium]|nr:EAL domain-containing protein [Gammaproteobacteria bacterium]